MSSSHNNICSAEKKFEVTINYLFDPLFLSNERDGAVDFKLPASGPVHHQQHSHAHAVHGEDFPGTRT